jgi:hypothetical protein
LRCREGEERAKRSNEDPGSSDREEPVMMFAFVLAVIGIVVLETLEHVVAKA